MLFLVLSFVCAAILILLFKVFERRAVPVFQAIVFNYWTAAICGLIFFPDKQKLVSGAVVSEPWFPLSIFLGMMFIAVFNATSITALKFGVSTASVASKLGLVFPVILAFVMYNESLGWMKGVGILFAFAAVILSSIKEQTPGTEKLSLSHTLLPFLVFIGSGACDCLTQFANKRYLMNSGVEDFSFFLFLSAGATGTCVLVWQITTGRSSLHWKSIIGGIALGIPNYLSFIFILKALSALHTWGSSVVFPVTNLGTVAFASLVGYIAFKERISKINLFGLAFAAIAIIFIVLSNYY